LDTVVCSRRTCFSCASGKLSISNSNEMTDRSPTVASSRRKPTLTPDRIPSRIGFRRPTAHAVDVTRRLVNTYKLTTLIETSQNSRYRSALRTALCSPSSRNPHDLHTRARSINLHAAVLHERTRFRRLSVCLSVTHDRGTRVLVRFHARIDATCRITNGPVVSRYKRVSAR